MKRRRFLAITASALMGGLGRADPAQAARLTTTALGADIEITLEGPGADVALEAIPRHLSDIERRFSLYLPDSDLVHLNRTGRLYAPDVEWLAILDVVKQVHAMSGGFFDPTVQPLWRDLANGGDGKAASALIGWERVKVQADQIALAPGQQITLNGIAQGFAAERLKSWLSRQGFRQALVNCGEFASLGSGWTIGIEDPVAGLVGRQRLDGTALSVSSPFETLVGGVPHILGPQGEAPLWSTVAIEAENAAIADGLSTAAVFMTRQQLQHLLNIRRNVRRITLVDMSGNLDTLDPA